MLKLGAGRNLGRVVLTACLGYVLAFQLILAGLSSGVRSNPQAERTYFAWAQGYMGGLMMRAPPGVDEGIDLLHPSFPLQQQADFMRAFCTGNLQADYADGVLELYRELRRRSSL